MTKNYDKKTSIQQMCKCTIFIFIQFLGVDSDFGMISNSRSLDEKIEVIFIYTTTRNFHETERTLNVCFPDRCICRNYVRELVAKFSGTANVNKKIPPGHLH